MRNKLGILLLAVMLLAFLPGARANAEEGERNGLVLDDATGEWLYYAADRVQDQYTGLAYYDNQWFYLQDGRLDTNRNGFVNYDGGVFLLGAGRLQSEVNGLVLDPSGTGLWYYLAGGQVQTQYTGLAMYDGAWFYVGAGRIVTEANGLVQVPDGSWWYMANGQIQTQYTGLTLYDGSWFYVIEGAFAINYTGEVFYNDNYFFVVNGQIPGVHQEKPIEILLNGNTNTVKGIDVSKWQGEIDFEKVKAAGYEFVMLRIYNGHAKDVYFDVNYDKAKAAGLKVGVYSYSEASTEEEACAEAWTVLSLLDGRSLDYPISMDLEDDKSLVNVTNETRTNMVLDFKAIVESMGYRFILYANYNWLTHYVDNARLDGCDIWIARYCDVSLGHRYTGGGNVAMWQYSSKGSVDGINGNVDMDFSGY